MTLGFILILLAFPAGFIGQALFGPIGGMLGAMALTLASVARLVHVVESKP